jgi:hypothetical protein
MVINMMVKFRFKFNRNTINQKRALKKIANCKDDDIVVANRIAKGKN